MVVAKNLSTLPCSSQSPIRSATILQVYQFDTLRNCHGSTLENLGIHNLVSYVELSAVVKGLDQSPLANNSNFLIKLQFLGFSWMESYHLKWDQTDLVQINTIYHWDKQLSLCISRRIYYYTFVFAHSASPSFIPTIKQSDEPGWKRDHFFCFVRTVPKTASARTKLK